MVRCSTNKKAAAAAAAAAKRSRSLRISLQMSESAGDGGTGAAPPPAIPPPTSDGRVPEPRPPEKRSIPPNIQQGRTTGGRRSKDSFRFWIHSQYSHFAPMAKKRLLPPIRPPDTDGGVEATAAGAGAGGRGGGHHARQRREGARERPEAVRVGQARGRPSGGGVAVSAAGKFFRSNGRKRCAQSHLIEWNNKWCKILAECFSSCTMTKGS